MTDKRKRFSADDIVDSLKQTGSSLRSVAGEFAENAAQNYHDRDAIGTAKTQRAKPRRISAALIVSTI